MDKYTEIQINTNYITLGQFIKYVGLIFNGSEAKSYILEHDIFVDGVKCEQRGKKLYPSSIIEIDNKTGFKITK